MGILWLYLRASSYEGFDWSWAAGERAVAAAADGGLLGRNVVTTALVEVGAAHWLSEQIYHCLVLGVRAGGEPVEGGVTVERLSWHSELSWGLAWSLSSEKTGA